MRGIRPIALILSLVSVAAVACTRGPTAPKDVIGALSPAEQLLLPEVTLTFIEVKGDSRCPSDAVCFWSGDATVVVAAQVPGTRRTPELFELHTHLDPKSFDFDNVTIRLDSLTPYPTTTASIPQDKYVAYFSAVRR